MRSSQPEPDTVPFNVHRQHEEDRGTGCISIDVGRDEHQRPVTSLRHLRREVDIFLLPNKAKLESCIKVYIIGEWNFSCDFSACGRDELEASEPWVIVDKLENFEQGGKQKLTWDFTQTKTAEEEEWKEGIRLISKVIESMKNLKELTWVSTLPFTESTWEVLPTSLTKLVLDVSQPVGLDSTDEKRESYLLQIAIRPLVNFTKLEELRIFGMHGSFQAVIWETVYRNEAEGEGIRILDLAMAGRPLIRDVGWLKAKRVEGLKVPKDVDRPYKGLDGKGVLHYNFGTGEYLDDFCMRKARIAAGVDEHKPLPLSRLKLDGFVVDSLPFEKELASLVFLSCGDHCVDAGLRAPKTKDPVNSWEGYVSNAITHCLIDWPHWTGIFDAEGRQLASDGTLVERPTERADDSFTLTTEHEQSSQRRSKKGLR